MSKKWLWLTIGVVVVAGLVLQVGCVPPTSPEEKARTEARAAAQLPKQKEWLSKLQAKALEAEKATGQNCRITAIFADVDRVDRPIVTVEIQDATKREARELADTIAGDYLENFPNTYYIAVFVDDWDSLERIYLKTYRGDG